MPRRDDLHSILIIGSGPIVIGQACEFDYSGTQACRVLREEGYRVILANSNPATIMTDPDFADATYIEPLTWEVLAAIIEREQPDAVLPTLGGQTGLNVAMELFERGLIGVPGTPEMIGANAEAIATAEDREQFKQAMIEIGLDVPRSGIAHDMDEARRGRWPRSACRSSSARPTSSAAAAPASPSTAPSFERLAANGLAASPISEILVEESIAGWKEFELEVMRDRADNCVIICSIENVDPMGVHTGDSITVAPQQTLTDVEYQQMRDAVDRLHPPRRRRDRRLERAVRRRPGDRPPGRHRDEPARVAQLGAGVEGDRVPDRQDRRQARRRLHARRDPERHHARPTPASFEPTIDYVVTKIPRWAFEKLPGTTGILGTQMQSVGEAMAIGRTFPESLQKGLRSLEQGRLGLNCDPAEAQYDGRTDDDLLATIEMRHARADLPGRRAAAPRRADRDDPRALPDRPVVPRPDADHRRGAARCSPTPGSTRMTPRAWRRAKRLGFSDAQLAHLWGIAETRRARRSRGGRRDADLQDGRHLRGRVRRRDAVPLLDLRGRERGPRAATARRSSSSARARTASARASSSTTAASTPASPCARPATRR